MPKNFRGDPLDSTSIFIAIESAVVCFSFASHLQPLCSSKHFFFFFSELSHTLLLRLSTISMVMWLSLWQVKSEMTKVVSSPGQVFLMCYLYLLLLAEIKGFRILKQGRPNFRGTWVPEWPLTRPHTHQTHPFWTSHDKERHSFFINP